MEHGDTGVHETLEACVLPNPFDDLSLSSKGEANLLVVISSFVRVNVRQCILLVNFIRKE